MDIESGFSFKFNIDPWRSRERILELISSGLDQRDQIHLSVPLIGGNPSIKGIVGPTANTHIFGT
jgi:hypothetical protein